VIQSNLKMKPSLHRTATEQIKERGGARAPLHRAFA